jgi:hypothetical protein
MKYDWQKIILVLIIIVLLAGLAWELKIIEDFFIYTTLSPEEQCEAICSEKSQVAYFSQNSCFCKEPVSFRKHWRCFYNITLEEDKIFSSKFDAMSVRNFAVKSVVKYPLPNAPASKIFGIYNEVINRIKYVSDPKKNEYVATPTETLEIRGGDCDDFSILLASMYEAVGLDASIVKVYNPDRAHVFVLVKIEQNLESFLKLYKNLLEKYTSYYSEKPFYFVVFADTKSDCEKLEKNLEEDKDMNNFYVIVDGTKGGYAGGSDSFNNFENIQFIKIGE